MVFIFYFFNLKFFLSEEMRNGKHQRGRKDKGMREFRGFCLILLTSLK